MKKRFINLKIVFFIAILILLAFDITILFAAESDNNSPSNLNNPQQQLQQIQQLQQSSALSNSSESQAVRQTSDTLTSSAAASSITPPSSPSPQVPLPQSQTQSSAAASNPGSAQNVNIAQNTNTVSETDINTQAFNAMTKNALPMSPEQIQKLRLLFNQTQYAAAAMPGTPPRPTATSQIVNLAPGSTPPVIRLSQGFVSSLVFLDSTGAPWPIESYDIGNPAAFNIQWNRSDNTMMIQSLTLYTYGNMAVRLQGLNTPVMITLIPGQKAVDYRIDMRIQGYGPNALPVSTNGLPGNANPELLNVLDGVPPANSKPVKIEGGTAEGWVQGDKLFVRTHFTLLSPAWTATMSSADGMKAYEIVKPTLQNAVLLASQNGKIVQLKIEGL